MHHSFGRFRLSLAGFWYKYYNIAETHFGYRKGKLSELVVYNALCFITESLNRKNVRFIFRFIKSIGFGTQLENRKVIRL